MEGRKIYIMFELCTVSAIFGHDSFGGATWKIRDTNDNNQFKNMWSTFLNSWNHNMSDCERRHHYLTKILGQFSNQKAHLWFLTHIFAFNECWLFFSFFFTVFAFTLNVIVSVLCITNLNYQFWNFWRTQKNSDIIVYNSNIMAITTSDPTIVSYQF